MKFGPVPTNQAKGSILAHSIVCSGRRLRKGMMLEDAHIDQLSASGISEVSVAELQDNDVHENQAAAELADIQLGNRGFQLWSDYRKHHDERPSQTR